MCVALNISLTKRPQGLRENGERRVPMAPQLLVGQRATLKFAAQLRPCGRYAAGYGLARAIMNDAMVKKIAAVKVMVTRGSHVCA